MKNKKSFIISSLVDFWAILTYIIIILLFYVLFKLTGAGISQQIISTDAQIETNTILLNILRTPVDNTKDFSDLIVEGNYDEFEYKIKNILDTYYNNNYEDCCWDMKIIFDDKTVKKIKGSQCKGTLVSQGSNKIIIPSYDLKTYEVAFITFDERSLGRKYQYPYCKKK